MVPEPRTSPVSSGKLFRTRDFLQTCYGDAGMQKVRESEERTAQIASEDKHQIVKVYRLEDARNLPWLDEAYCTLES